MEVGRKRGISRKMQAKDPQNAYEEGLPSTLPSPRLQRRFRPMQQQQAAKHLQHRHRHRRATSEGLDSMLGCRGIMRAITSSRLPRPNYPSTKHHHHYYCPQAGHLRPFTSLLYSVDCSKYTIIIKLPLHPPSIPLQPAKYRKHVRQGRRSYSLQPAPCLYPTAGASTECAFDISGRAGCCGATE